jgi:hypothetical protein
MDPNLVYVKTPTGYEAVRQRTRLVQRKLRAVLIQVDGKMTVGELSVKMGDPLLVEGGLQELEEAGFIVPSRAMESVCVDSPDDSRKDQISALSQFSTSRLSAPTPSESMAEDVAVSSYPSFTKPTSAFSSKKNVVTASPEIVPKRESRPVRGDGGNRIPILKWALFGSCGALFALIGLALFYPYENFKPAIEVEATRFLQTPVEVGRVGVTLLPQPHLYLADVRIGDAGDSRIETIRIASPLGLLRGGPHRISSINIEGAAISANRLIALPMFNSTVDSAAGNIVLRRLRIERSEVTIRDIALRDISGEVIFNPDGSVEKANFQAVDRSISLNAMPTPQGLLLNIEGMAWKPAGIPVSFDSLQAKGLLQKNRLLIQSIDTTFLGGILKGSWLLDWSEGFVMAGDAGLIRVDSRKASAAFAPSLKLEGDLGGSLRLRAGGSDWASMWKNLEATFDADVTRGIFYGVDLGEVARRGRASEVRSGSTKFDRLRTTITINSGQVKGRDIRLDAGMMTATGQFVANSDRQVNANLTVGIRTSVSNVRVPVRVSGILPELTAFGSQ